MLKLFISKAEFNIKAAIIYVPATILSEIISCSAFFKFVTPCTRIVFVPWPSIFAPIFIRQFDKSSISGSLAALEILVSPFANTEAISIFSVAPTLGKGNLILFPINCDLTLPTTKPF